MANWKQYDGLESAGAKAGGNVADFCDRLMTISLDLEPERDMVVSAAKALTDAMRIARRAAYGVVSRERGPRS